MVSAGARAPSSVAAPLPSPSTKKTVPKLMRDDRADRLAIDDRDHARPLVLPQQRIVVRRTVSEAITPATWKRPRHRRVAAAAWTSTPATTPRHSFLLPGRYDVTELTLKALA